MPGSLTRLSAQSRVFFSLNFVAVNSLGVGPIAPSPPVMIAERVLGLAVHCMNFRAGCPSGERRNRRTVVCSPGECLSDAVVAKGTDVVHSLYIHLGRHGDAADDIRYSRRMQHASSGKSRTSSHLSLYLNRTLCAYWRMIPIICRVRFGVMAFSPPVFPPFPRNFSGFLRQLV